jgi:hypothetical protein
MSPPARGADRALRVTRIGARVVIISGQQLGNARRWLAAHLQNAADNEVIEIAEVSGTVARDIDGAVKDMDALVKMTNAKEGVYAAFINPSKPLSREQFMRAIALIEERLGLSGQARIILFHVKNGRHHCHIVWSRIDIARRKAIQLSHDRQKLRAVARQLGEEFDLPLPPGLERDRGAERFKLPKQPTRAEKAQTKKSGITAEERRAAITDAWRKSDSAEAFVNALEQAGYMVAQGDRRAFVVVDLAGDVHSIARQIEDVRTKDVAKKLAGLNLALLPTVERAKVLMAQRLVALADVARADAKRVAESNAAWEKLRALQKKRRFQIDLLWQQMKTRQAHEWKVLQAHVFRERQQRLAKRAWEAWGLAVYLKKIAVIRQLLEYHRRKRLKTMDEHHRSLAESLRRRHENEALELRRRYQALTRLERRETASFEQQLPGSLASKIRHLHEERIYVLPREYSDIAVGWDRLRTNAIDITEHYAGRINPDAEKSLSVAYHSDAQEPLTSFQHNAADMTMPVITVDPAFGENARDITSPGSVQGNVHSRFTTPSWRSPVNPSG